MYMSGTAWSNIFYDETHESAINLQMRSVIKSLSDLTMNIKLHYIPFRAKAQKTFLKLFNISKLEIEQRRVVTFKPSLQFKALVEKV